MKTFPVLVAVFLAVTCSITAGMRQKEPMLSLPLTVSIWLLGGADEAFMPKGLYERVQGDKLETTLSSILPYYHPNVQVSINQHIFLCSCPAIPLGGWGLNGLYV